MSAEVSTRQLFRGYSRFLHRYHFVLFVVTALGGLAVIVFLLNNTIQLSTNTTLSVEPAQPGFDTQTIEKLRSLKQTNSSQELQFPGGRTNPFVE